MMTFAEKKIRYFCQICGARFSNIEEKRRHPCFIYLAFNYAERMLRRICSDLGYKRIKCEVKLRKPENAAENI